jgi:hypothetical protein
VAIRTEGVNHPSTLLRAGSGHEGSQRKSRRKLQQIYVAGFELKVFERFPKCVGVVRDNCIALMVPSPDGLQMLGTPGWLMGEAMGVLVESGGRKVFQAKQEIIEATPERLEALSRFREDLQRLLRPTS